MLGSARSGGIKSNHKNWGFPVRMGSDYVGQNGEWEMGSECDWFSYKHFEVEGSASGTETFSTFPSWVSR